MASAMYTSEVPWQVEVPWDIGILEGTMYPIPWEDDDCQIGRAMRAMGQSPGCAMGSMGP